MIRINGTYPTDSIIEPGLSTTDDSLFIVSLVHASQYTLTVNLKDMLFRQGNVLIFSERETSADKEKNILGDKIFFDIYGHSKPT